MKKIKLTEATAKTPLEKMQDTNSGKRNQNWKACSDNKLKLYYKICIENNLSYALQQCEQEILARDYHNWLCPFSASFSRLNCFNTQFAQHLWDERNTCHRIIQEAIDSPYVGPPGSRPSEYLLKAYIFIKCMGHDSEFKMMEIWIKNHMKDQDTYYNKIPTILDEICQIPNVTDDIAKAIAGVNFS